MKLVAENGSAGLLHIKFDLLGGQVTTIAVALYRKGEKTVVAGTAGAVLLHFHHGVASVLAVGPEKRVVAVSAAVHLEMPVMGESGISSELDILDGMTLAAVTGHRKGRLAVVAGATGRPFLHLRHCVGFPLGAGCEELVVTLIAFIHAQMEVVTEIHLPCPGNIKNYILGAHMTSVAAAADTESNICIVTGTAGPVLLHFSHGKAAAPFAACEYAAMAVNADIHFFGTVCMYLVAEEGGTGSELDIR